MIKVGKLTLVLLTTGYAQCGWAEVPRWANPEVYEVNREPAHAFSLVYPDSERARPEPDWENPFAGSSRYVMLNGEWKFKWTENLSAAPADFYKPDFDVSAWDEIPVPLPWQMAGYGQFYYRNATLSMLEDPRNLEGNEVRKGAENGTMDLLNPDSPIRQRKIDAALSTYVPTAWNPVGSYVTEFEVPDGWRNERVVLHFSGVKSTLTCWINGEEVGYSQDSFTPAEFDITRFLKPGSNRLAVQVLRWSDGTYLENQDRIRMCGIIRDVYLFATPKTHISDFYVKADVAESLDAATLSVDVELRNTGEKTANNQQVEMELIDAAGKTVCTQSATMPAVATGKTVSATLSAAVEHPALWHSEEPNLYTLLIKLKKGANEFEVIRQDVGFRRFTHDALGNYYLNGKRYTMRGINRSDCSPETGYSVSYQDMLEDVTLMRQLNIYNVRTSHNPNDPRFHALCNRFGITVLDEANVEAHGHEEIFLDPSVESGWRSQAVFRMVNMVERDKNQPCVLLWSLGNEQFERGVPDQPAVRAMYDAAKAIDPTRGVFCERMFNNKTGISAEPYLDAVGPMYNGKEKFAARQEANEDRRPFFMSEYAHAMGNSMANLAEFWEYFEQHEGMNGGQIWDWRDQSVYYPLPGLEGKHLTYGGDWNEPCGNDRVFCMNGVVLPDHGFTGKSYEVKGVYQQVAFSAGDTAGHFKVKNKFALKNLNEFDVAWSLLKDGVAVKSGKLALDVAPLSEAECALPVEVSSFAAESDYHFNIDVRLKEAQRWADAGFVVAQGQVQLQKGTGSSETVAQQGKLDVQRLPKDQLVVRCKDSSISFDMKQALLTQYIHQGQELLAPDSTLPGLEFNANFHPTDDFFVWPRGIAREGMKRGLNAFKKTPVSAQVLRESAQSVTVETINDFLTDKKEGYRHTATYTVLPSGIIQVDNHVQKINLKENDLCMRIGVRLPVAKRYGRSSYLGYGPHENYPTRRAWERFGVYSHPANDFFSHYVRPQECGNRTGLKWIALQDEEGGGLQIVGEKAGNGSVMPWSVEKFRTANHIPELGESTRWIMRYDAEFAGIGHLDNFEFKGDYTFSYSIRPLSKGSDPSAVAWPSIPETFKRAYGRTGEPIINIPGIPATWKRVSEHARVTYSSRSQWAPKDTLLTSQEGNCSFHTDAEKKPWLIVDLKKKMPIAGMEILNRDDAAAKRATHLHVWVSNDKKTWDLVFKSGEAKERWVILLDQPRSARYVKVGLINKQPKFFHLKGVSVFAKK